MACCGKRKNLSISVPPSSPGGVAPSTAAQVAQRVTQAAQPASQFVIAPAKSWLPFNTDLTPPGGWGLPHAFSASSPEEAAQKLANIQLRDKTFTSLQKVYSLLRDAYCARVSSPPLCGKHYKT